MFERLDRRLRGTSPDAAQRLSRLYARIDALSGWWDGYCVPPRTGLRRLRESAIVEGADASTGICRRGFHRLPGTVPRSEDTVTAAFRAGCQTALQLVVDRHADLPPAEATLLSLHEALFSRSPADAHQRGRYRNAPPREGNLQRWGLEPAALRRSGTSVAPGETAVLLSWVSSRLSTKDEFHPLPVVGAFLLEFLAIQPFSDGNGRMARLLSTLLLLRTGYAFPAWSPPDQTILARQDETLIALRKSQATRNTAKPDITSWLFAFLGILESSAEGLKNRALAPSPARRLSSNQEGALALGRTHGEVTNRLVADALSLPRETAKQTLGRLCELGLLERIGMGRATRYRYPGVR